MPTKEKKDLSIYERVYEEVLQILAKYEDTKKEILDSQLYLLDDKGMAELMQCKKSLIMEYGERIDCKSEADINSIVKIINPNAPSFYYFLYEKESWEEVVCQEKVRNRILGRFAKYKNKRKRDHRQKYKELEYSKETVAQKMDELYKLFGEQEARLMEILENYDEWEVRISAYEKRKKYGTISYKYFENGLLENKEVRKSSALRNTVPNVLWFKDVNRINANKKILEFLDGAEEIFEDVYCKHISKGGVKRIITDE